MSRGTRKRPLLAWLADLLGPPPPEPRRYFTKSALHRRPAHGAGPGRWHTALGDSVGPLEAANCILGRHTKE